MNTQSLASAFQNALNRNTPTRLAITSNNSNSMLLVALERSATVRDQIVQRRIGMSTEIPAIAR